MKGLCGCFPIIEVISISAKKKTRQKNKPISSNQKNILKKFKSWDNFKNRESTDPYWPGTFLLKRSSRDYDFSCHPLKHRGRTPREWRWNKGVLKKKKKKKSISVTLVHTLLLVFLDSALRNWPEFARKVLFWWYRWSSRFRCWLFLKECSRL